MRPNRIILLVCCMTLVGPAVLRAQTVTHYLTAEAGIGYSSGFLGEVGVGYAFANRLLLVHTGVELGYTFRRTAIPDYTEQEREVDSEGMPYTAVYDYSHQVDRSHIAELRVPVLIGVQYNNWYMLAGIKAGLLLGGKRVSEADVTKAADYGMFNDIFQDMPNHGLTTEHLTFDNRLATGATAYVSLETGLHWQYLGGALFADYRLPGYSFDNRPVDRLTVGAKLTFAFGWHKRRSLPCKCIPQGSYQSSRRR